MTPEERRRMIVAAALPLVTELGSAVTTARVARVAGIGEATIFRAFADKEALLDAVVAEVLRPDRVLEEIAAISLEQPLDARLSEAVEVLRAHLERMGAVLGSLRASGHRSDQRRGAPAEDGRRESFDRTRDAVAALFEPERERLRLAPERLAEVFVGLVLARARPLAAGDGDSPPTTHELVELLLHGALEGEDR